MATRKSNPRKGRRRSSSRANTSRRRYSSRRRRNPPGLSVRGITRQVTEGVAGGIAVTAGKVAARTIPAAIGLPAAGFAGIATQLGAGVAAGMLTDRMVSRRFGPYVLAGAFSSVLESLLKKANVPIVSTALGDESDLLAAYPLGTFGAYPQQITQGSGGDFGAYPRVMTPLGDTYVEQ